MPQPPDDRITQIEFVNNLKSMMPELRDIPEQAIIDNILKERPELRGKFITNQELSQQATDRMDTATAPIGEPGFWKRHPIGAALTKGTLDTIPGITSAAGAALATPETFGGGTVIGGGLGAGVGRGMRDITAQLLGLEQGSTLGNATNIGMDTGLGMILPGMFEAAKAPIRTGRDFIRHELEFNLPPRLRRWLVPGGIEDIAYGRGTNPYKGPYPGTNIKPSQPEWTPPETDFKFTAPGGQTGTGSKYYAPRSEFGGPGDVREVAPEVKISGTPDPYENIFRRQAEIRAAEAAKYAPKPPASTTGTGMKPGPVSGEPLKFQVEGKAAEELAKGPAKMRIIHGPGGKFTSIPDYGKDINAKIDEILAKYRNKK